MGISGSESIGKWYYIMSWWNNWYVRFLSWRVRHIKERNFIIVLSLLVGIITGLAGVFLKNSVHYTHQFITERLFCFEVLI